MQTNKMPKQVSNIGGSAFIKKVDVYLSSFSPEIDFSDCVVFPGFCDVHVHFREPGFFYKESIATGSLAAAHGGYTSVCTMPNLKPAPDTKENIQLQLDLIKKNAVIDVYPYATITKGQNGQQLSDMADMADLAVAFSDDGRGVQDPDIMLNAMRTAKALGKIITAHCEDNSLLKGGYIHDGEYAKKHNHKGICSASEYEQIKRDIDLVRQTGCAYHVCHISTKESVELIRQAKKEGLDITCETAPHYLVLTDNDLKEDGRYKMNPPLRSEADRLALIEGIKDGTIDMIATDHAPHSSEEKSKGLKDSAFGIVGLETAFQVLYTHLVKKDIITLEKLIELLADNPRRRFGILLKDSFTVWKLDKKVKVQPEEFFSKGKATPFEEWELYGQCIMTVCNGKTVYNIKE